MLKAKNEGVLDQQVLFFVFSIWQSQRPHSWFQQYAAQSVVGQRPVAHRIPSVAISTKVAQALCVQSPRGGAMVGYRPSASGHIHAPTEGKVNGGHAPRLNNLKDPDENVWALPVIGKEFFGETGLNTISALGHSRWRISAHWDFRPAYIGLTVLSSGVCSVSRQAQPANTSQPVERLSSLTIPRPK